MFITYRRTGGVLALLAFAAVALSAAVLTVAAAAAALLVAVVVAVVAFLVRAVRPASRRRHAVPAATPWPQETIEATLVRPTESSPR
jgi:MFS superfamily sulfate permease-like transporter